MCVPVLQETSIDRHLAVNVRHNTADIAALQGSMEKTSEDAGEEEEEEHGVTAIDDEIIATVMKSHWEMCMMCN